MSKRKPVRFVAVISDLHPGSRMSVMPREGLDLDDGTHVTPTPLQLKICDMWDEYRRWIDHETGGEPIAFVHNGDALEGAHHDTVSTWSNSRVDQARAAETLLRPWAERSGGRFWMTRGTPAHVGQSGQDEELLGKILGSVPNEQGQHVPWQIWMRLGAYLIHFAHEIATSTSPFAKSSALQREIALSHLNSGRWGDEPPDMIVRSHKHESSEVSEPTRKGRCRCYVTPAWQALTPFMHRRPRGGAQPEIGGALIVAGDNGIYVKDRIWRLERPKEVVV